MKGRALFAAFFAFASETFAINLEENAAPLFYSCRNAAQAGLYFDKATDEIRGTDFRVDPTDRWDFVLKKFGSYKELPEGCRQEAESKGKAAAMLMKGDVAKGDYCLEQTFFGQGGKQLTGTKFCSMIVGRNKHIVFCGKENQISFDTERRYGVSGENSVFAFMSRLTTSLTVSKFVCERLDR